MKLVHARPGDTLERQDADGSWTVIEITAAFTATCSNGKSIRMIDYMLEDGTDVHRIRADTDPFTDWRRVDHETDAQLGFTALSAAGSIPPALTEGQMIRAATDALGVEMISRVPGDGELLPAGVTVRVIGAAAGGRRNARRRGRRP